MDSYREWNYWNIGYQDHTDACKGQPILQHDGSLPRTQPLPEPHESPEVTNPEEVKIPKKSFRKSLSNSLSRATGKSIRSIAGIFGSAKGAVARDDAPKSTKPYERAFAETSLYLNGLSQKSAFRRDYAADTMRELGNVQSRYVSETIPTRIRSRRSRRIENGSVGDGATPPPPSADDIATMPMISARNPSRTQGAKGKAGMLFAY
jgi:hypothetical protein